MWLNASLSHDDVQKTVYHAISTANPGFGLNLTYAEAMNMPLPYLTEFLEMLMSQREAMARANKRRG